MRYFPYHRQGLDFSPGGQFRYFPLKASSQKLQYIFHDTSLTACLLDIQSANQVQTHYARGALFEDLIITEILKRRFSQGRPANAYFWRDKTGDEIDCLVEKGLSLLPIEIKSGRTVTPDYFKGIDYFLRLAGQLTEKPYIVYGGTSNRERTKVNVLSWKSIAMLDI